VEAWGKAKKAVTGEVPMAENATREELMAYQYLLHRQRCELLKMQERLNERRAAADESSRRRAALSSTSTTAGGHPRRSSSRLNHIPFNERDHLVHDLDLSFMSVDAQGNIVPKTPQASLVATQTYMIATQPEANDPRAALHHSTLAGLGMIEASLADKEVIQRPKRSPRHRNSPRHEVITRRSRSPLQAWINTREGDARNNITQQRIDRSQQERDEREYDDDEAEMCGASCFTRRVRRTPVPKDFKLPHDRQKFDGLQEPESWLSDFLQTVRILGGTKATAMQSLQLHLSGAARSWLRKLPNESISSWDDLADQFTRNFRSTYKRPASIEEVRACVQKLGEPMRAYIQGWNIIKNSAENVSDERAIDAFANGLRRKDFIEDLGRANPKNSSMFLLPMIEPLPTERSSITNLGNNMIN
jgi:hypothetical protein